MFLMSSCDLYLPYRYCTVLLSYSGALMCGRLCVLLLLFFFFFLSLLPVLFFFSEAAWPVFLQLRNQRLWRWISLAISNKVFRSWRHILANSTSTMAPAFDHVLSCILVCMLLPFEWLVSLFFLCLQQCWLAFLSLKSLTNCVALNIIHYVWVSKKACVIMFLHYSFTFLLSRRDLRFVLLCTWKLFALYWSSVCVYLV